MVYERMEQRKRMKLIRTHYEKMLSYLSNGEKLSEAPIEWFLGNEKRFKRPPFGNFSEPEAFNDLFLDMR